MSLSCSSAAPAAADEDSGAARTATDVLTDCLRTPQADRTRKPLSPSVPTARRPKAGAGASKAALGTARARRSSRRCTRIGHHRHHTAAGLGFLFDPRAGLAQRHFLAAPVFTPPPQAAGAACAAREHMQVRMRFSNSSHSGLVGTTPPAGGRAVVCPAPSSLLDRQSQREGGQTT